MDPRFHVAGIGSSYANDPELPKQALDLIKVVSGDEENEWDIANDWMNVTTAFFAEEVWVQRTHRKKSHLSSL